ncbi:hypothetical protein [Nocardia transvalensis]|uniref:hypothetical protein n=1 Tax=Nocardia transvalensis TaxID=37333 RepID=UPI001893B4B5|nr:hypothetical protein [Nocardia transvalensis]MBF6329221.1 hypothetical protein [Nocardia transvalensis]
MNRRVVARVVVAGAVVVAPLAVVGVSAQAAPVSEPAVTQVRHHWDDPWRQVDPWSWDRHERRDDCDPWDRRHHHPGQGWRQFVPPGWLGSS